MKENEPKDILETYPILPLRNTILFPNQIIPIYIGRQQSLNLINDISSLEKKYVKGYPRVPKEPKKVVKG